MFACPLRDGSSSNWRSESGRILASGVSHACRFLQQCCITKYIELGSGSWNLAQFGSKFRNLPLNLKKCCHSPTVEARGRTGAETFRSNSLTATFFRYFAKARLNWWRDGSAVEKSVENVSSLSPQQRCSDIAERLHRDSPHCLLDNKISFSSFKRKPNSVR